MYRAAVFATLIFTWWLALATLYGHDPGLLLRITREDGPVEWATVFALLLLAALVAKRLSTATVYAALNKPKLIAGWGLVAMAILSAGEEISWGQRIFGFKTGEAMSHLNYQHETNLHNLVPGALFNGLIVFALGIGFVLIPLLWRKFAKSPPQWLPGQEASLMMLDAILINHYRFATPPEQIGILVIIGILLWQTIEALKNKNWINAATVGFGWATALILYHCKAVLRAANAQYEIRELLIVIIALIWSWQTLSAYERK